MRERVVACRNKTRSWDAMCADSERARIVHEVGPNRFVVVAERALLLTMSLTGFCLHCALIPEAGSESANSITDYILTPAAWGSITMLQAGLFLVYLTDCYCDPHLSVMWDVAAVLEYIVLLGFVAVKGDKTRVNIVIPPFAAAIHIGTLIQDVVWIIRVRNKLRTRLLVSVLRERALSRKRSISTDCSIRSLTDISGRHPSPPLTPDVAFIKRAQGESLTAKLRFEGRPTPSRDTSSSRAHIAHSSVFSHIAPPPQQNISKHQDMSQVASVLLATTSPSASPQPSAATSHSTVLQTRRGRKPFPWWWTIVTGVPSSSPLSGLVHMCSRSGTSAGRRTVRRRRRSRWHTRYEPRSSTQSDADPQCEERQIAEHTPALNSSTVRKAVERRSRGAR